MTEFFYAAAKRTVVITGGNQGVGFACAAALADSRQNCCIIIAGHNRKLRLVVIGPATEEQARESAESMGVGLVVVPGERFYAVEVTTLPIGSSN